MLRSKTIASPEIVPITDLSDYARETTTLHVLEDALRSAEAKLEYARLDRSMRGSRPPKGPRGEAITALRNKLAAEVEEAGTANSEEAPAISPEGERPAVRKAFDLLRGHRAPAQDLDREIREGAENVETFCAAVVEQNAVVADLRGEKSLAVAIAQRDHHSDLVRAVYTAACALAQASEAERRHAVAILQAGYDIRQDVMVRPVVPAAALLGSESDWNSQISQLRRLLEERGII